MRKALVLTCMLGCASSVDAPDEYQIPGSSDVPQPEAVCTTADTWEEAYIVWETARCAITERCFPASFMATFPDGIAECVEQQMRWHCGDQAAAWCATDYAERCQSLETCVTGMSAMACDADDVPQSCYEAIK